MTKPLSRGYGKKLEIDLEDLKEELELWKQCEYKMLEAARIAKTPVAFKKTTTGQVGTTFQTRDERLLFEIELDFAKAKFIMKQLYRGLISILKGDAKRITISGTAALNKRKDITIKLSTK